MTVNFYTFSKRQNSTARPTGAAVESFDCKLKDSSGVLRPTLEIYKQASWNPTALNYAYISDYGRYYYVSDWRWIVGRWECILTVDALASWKTQIGAASKYILRSYAAQDKMLIDTMYPTKATNPIVWQQTTNLFWSQNFSGGIYVIGIANASSSGSSPVTYYYLDQAGIRSLISFMLPPAGDLWTDPKTYAQQELVKAIYDPFSYVKSCLWFPWSRTLLNTVLVQFGNYAAPVLGEIIESDAGNWYATTVNIGYPTGIDSLEAKYRSAPYCKMSITFNPWGTIDLNPVDFYGCTGIILEIYPDLINGDALLRIYRQDGTIPNTTLTFIDQRSAHLGVSIQLSSSSLDVSGILTGALGAVSGAAAAVTGGATGLIHGGVAALGSMISAAEAAVPRSGSVGQQSGGIAAVDGKCILTVSYPEFVQADPQENGYPLCQIRQISTIPGYIKCQEGDVPCAAYAEELSTITEHLTGGFYYE